MVLNFTRWAFKKWKKDKHVATMKIVFGLGSKERPLKYIIRMYILTHWLHDWCPTHFGTEQSCIIFACSTRQPHATDPDQSTDRVRNTGIAGLVGIRAEGVSDQYCSQRLLLKGLQGLKVTLFGSTATELRRLIKICVVCFAASQ